MSHVGLLVREVIFWVPCPPTRTLDRLSSSLSSLLPSPVPRTSILLFLFVKLQKNTVLTV